MSAGLLFALAFFWGDVGGDGGGAQAASALSDKPIPMKTEEELPARTPPIIEIGPAFLGTGNIDPGIELPTGAVWQPALWVFGDYRTAVQYFDSGPGREVQEWANRLDLFFNLQFTPTERILFGISPLRRDGAFTGVRRLPDEDNRGGFSAFNFDTTTLFFEGEFGEIFPNLDPQDRGSYDVGFAVGRQPLFFQEGMMVNDTVDAFAVTRDTIVIPGITQDMRVTGLFGWNGVDRDDNRERDDTYLFGLFSEADLRASTVQFDLAYVLGDESELDGAGDGFFIGASAIQRIGLWNTAFRVNASIAENDNAPDAVDDGVLLFGEVSRTLPHSEDLVYLNAFWGIDNYSSAARDPTAGGPLGRVGILFAAVGLGDYGAALGNRADEAAGGAVGYQMFFNDERTQLVLELGGRYRTVDAPGDAVAAGLRFQQAIGDRFLLQVDGFLSRNFDADDGAGIRTEFVTRF